MNKHIKNILIILGLSIAITFSFDFFIGGMNGDLARQLMNILYGIIIGGAISLSGTLTRLIMRNSDISNYPIRTYTIILLSVTLYISFVVFAINAIWGNVAYGHDLSSVFTHTGTLLMSVVTIFIGLIIFFIILSKSYISRLINAEKEIQDSKEEVAKYQYETLKNQINPHFLFNSLNVLSSLIYKDVEKADEFTIKLANIYRYILDHQDDELVTLEEELLFIEKYVYLQTIRFDQNFKIDIKNTEGHIQKLVVPMALQLLIENVFKHNIVSEQSPMLVTISVEDNYLIISNPIQPKVESESSHQLGLRNIEKQYQILTDKNCEFTETEDQFTVRLPLLEIHSK